MYVNSNNLNNKKCMALGNYDKNCFSKIKLSNLINNLVPISSSIPTDAKEEEAAVGKIVKESLVKANKTCEN